jgi:peptidoglycan hydrolase CwlO-like protein
LHCVVISPHAKLEQRLARLLAEMNAMYSNQKEMKEEMKTNQAKIDACLEEIKSW